MPASIRPCSTIIKSIILKVMKQNLPIQAALHFGWKNFRAKPGLWIGATLLSGTLSYFPTAVQFMTDRWSIIASVNVISTALCLVITLGFIQLTLKAHRHEPITWSDLWSQAPLLFRYFLGNIIYGVIAFLGFLLFIVPGIILVLRLFYFSYFMIEQRLPLIAALQASWKLTQGRTGQLFLFSLIQAAIVIVGMLALGVGVLVAFPVIILAEAYIYYFMKQTPATTV